MLIVFGGLPGTGKSTVAQVVARRLGAVYLRIDTIEHALRSCEVVGEDLGPAGYVAAYRLAEDNLRLGAVVVADSVNPLALTRDAWRSVAERCGVRLAEVEVICSDAAEHRRRVETRAATVEGRPLPTWQDVIDRDYDPWDRPHIVIDTASTTVEEAAAALLGRLSPLPAHTLARPDGVRP